MAKKIELTFEEALTALEETIARLESGDLSLEEALTLYEKGQSLVAACNNRLENATLRVAQISSDGEESPISVE